MPDLNNVRCPVCQYANDFVEYRFHQHTENNVESIENPSDIDSVLMCPNLHFFVMSEDGPVRVADLPADRHKKD